MISEEIILFAVVGVAFLAALSLSFFFSKRRNKLGLSIIGVMWAAFTGIAFFGMYNASGWDVLGYAAALIGVSAPVGVGGLVGALVGWAKGSKEQDEQPSSRAGHTDTAPTSR